MTEDHPGGRWGGPDRPGERPPAPRRKRQGQLRVAFDSAPVGMAITTDTGAFVQINAAFCDLLGVAHSALLGRRLEDFAAPDAAAALSDGWRLAAGGWRPADRPRHTTDTELPPAIGHLLPVTLTCARVPTSADGGAYLVIHVQDGSERRAAEAELTRRTLHDPLTGLPNRVLLLDRLTRALARLERHPSTLAVLFADLNGFKAINGTHGHSTGDQVLVAVAHRLQQLQRPGDPPAVTAATSSWCYPRAADAARQPTSPNASIPR